MGRMGRYMRLVAADSKGMITVWSKNLFDWRREFTFDTSLEVDWDGKSRVTGLKWSPDGYMVAILVSQLPPAPKSKIATASARNGHESSVAKHRSSSSGSGKDLDELIRNADDKIPVRQVLRRSREDTDKLYDSLLIIMSKTTLRSTPLRVSASKYIPGLCDHIQWTSDSETVMVCVADQEVHLYECEELELVSKIGLEPAEARLEPLADDLVTIFNSVIFRVGGCVPPAFAASKDQGRVVAMKVLQETLLVSFQSGVTELRRHECDRFPFVFNADVIITDASISPDGKYIGICGHAYKGRANNGPKTDDGQEPKEGEEEIKILNKKKKNKKRKNIPPKKEHEPEKKVVVKIYDAKPWRMVQHDDCTNIPSNFLCSHTMSGNKVIGIDWNGNSNSVIIGMDTDFVTLDVYDNRPKEEELLIEL